ncbi:MAG: hypothetical protein FWE67_11070 [Planctomycetaceae bacterium]|nr:hypothetical protein [Planctomycetaceae bacterium]
MIEELRIRIEPVDSNTVLLRSYVNQKSGQVAEEVAVSNLPPDLQRIIAAWETLPKSVQKAIKALVKSASRKKQRSR